jgi:DNA-binding response OmpR family regulator
MGKTVLTVDDSRTLRMLVAKHLAPYGVKTIDAENGEQGIMVARESKPDVILLDYNMPIMDGYHTLTELKSNPTLKSIPVIMLTTETVKETVVKLMKLGLKDYIAKPFTRDVLLEKLNPILDLYSGDKIPPELAAASIGNQTAIDPAKRTILAVDDKANILELLKEYLSDQFNIITADSGKAAVAVFTSTPFDYLILDLSMPDMNGFDVFSQYLQKKKGGASTRKVIAMTLRTAQADIERASKQGIQILLFKPFNRNDALKAIESLIDNTRDGQTQNLRYLTVNGKIRILDCPSEKSPKYHSIASSLSSGVLQEIDNMAEEGLSQLIIRVGEGFLADINVTKKFIELVEHARELSLSIRLVADTEQSREALKQFSETADLCIDVSLECALNSLNK